MIRAITPGAVFFGLLVSSPALYDALTDPQASVNTALVRFLLGVAAAAVGLSMLRTLVAGYARSSMPHRRASDHAGGDQHPGG
jgi:hypothetical protein